ncbi:MAG: hypothetical protein WC709_01790 [Thermoleophilia bacterium]
MSSHCTAEDVTPPAASTSPCRGSWVAVLRATGIGVPEMLALAAAVPDADRQTVGCHLDEPVAILECPAAGARRR